MGTRNRIYPLKCYMNKRKILSIIISLFILLVIGGCSLGSEMLNNKGISEKSLDYEKINEYLKNNYSRIDLTKDSGIVELSVLDDDIKDKEIFFTGENHGVKANSILNQKFLKYFKEKADFKYYLCELSYSDGYFLNKFLRSGDMKILEEMYRPLKGTYYWNRDSYEHWRWLYEYNKTLPQNRKIEVVGVDIEHQPENAMHYMNDVIKNKDIPKELEKVMGDLKNISNTEGDLKDFCVTLKRDIDNREDIYKKLLGEDFIGFKLVTDNVIYKFEAYNDRKKFNKVRDRMMYDNFKIIYNTLPKGKYYGQWGLNHIFQGKQNDVKWIGTAMNESGSELENKILSVAYAYDRCKFMSKKSNRTYGTDDINSYNSRSNPMNDYIKEDCTIFKLTGENSLFREELIWPIHEEYPKEGVTTDYFQYIVVIKNSKATEPLNDKYN